MKGLILAGGTGSRLFPVTSGTNKQLLPIYDKPMIYYPISTLMLAGIKEILIITNPESIDNFERALGDGSVYGLNIEYAVQAKPEGLAQAFIIGEKFIGDGACCLVLGDNIFYGSGIFDEVDLVGNVGAHVFTYEVSNPSDYGVLELDESGSPLSIREKPTKTNSKLAVTGLYFFDSSVAGIAKTIKPSPRGELEITSVIESYLNAGKLKYTKLSRGYAWLDTGTPAAMHDASSFVKLIEDRTGLRIACLEEIAWRNQWISNEQLENRGRQLGNSQYGKYLLSLLEIDPR